VVTKEENVDENDSDDHCSCENDAVGKLVHVSGLSGGEHPGQCREEAVIKSISNRKPSKLAFKQRYRMRSSL